MCESQGYVLESKVLSEVKDLIETFVSNDGKLDEKEFNDAVAQLKKRCQGKRNDIQCKKMIIEIVEDNSYKIKSGLFSNWYQRMKKDVGM